MLGLARHVHRGLGPDPATGGAGIVRVVVGFSAVTGYGAPACFGGAAGAAASPGLRRAGPTASAPARAAPSGCPKRCRAF